MTTASTSPIALPGELLLRTAEPADLPQIGDLLVRRGEPADALDHRLVVEDRDLGWSACAVVEHDGRIVSTATLLDETVQLRGPGCQVELPAGQVELVATDEHYEGRGLVRALMGWAHQRSAERGHLLQVMIGIPYFYRLFGYEYAVDQPPVRTLRGLPTEPPPHNFRPATADDLPALAALQDGVHAGFDVTVPHPAARRRWLLAHEASRTWVVERDGAVVATGRTTGPDDDEVLLAEAAARDADAAEALVRGVAALAPDGSVRVADRIGTVVHEVLDARLESAASAAEQYYLRLPDTAAVLDAVRPVLSARLTASGLDRAGKDVLLSTYRQHFRMSVTDAGLDAVTVGGVMQAPGAHGGAGVAPDWLPALLFGQQGMAGLSRLRPDVYPGPDAELFEALFPPLTADLLTYYLPF